MIDLSLVVAVGVSYVSIFIVSYHIMFWVIGVAYTLAWDYLPGIPQGEDANRRVSWYEKPMGSVIARYILRKDNEITFPPFVKPQATSTRPEPSFGESSGSATPELDPSSPLLAKSAPSYSQPVIYNTATDPTRKPTHNILRSHRMQRVRQLTLSMFTPITSALYISLPIALVRPLKALFVQVPQSSGDMTVIWPAPDGRPPLAFVIDTGKYLFSCK